jgi:hypothetical protein
VQGDRSLEIELEGRVRRPFHIHNTGLNELPPAIAGIVRAAYGDATALIFLISGVLAIVTLLAVLAIREVPLRTETGMERERAEALPGAGATAATERLSANGNGNANGGKPNG